MAWSSGPPRIVAQVEDQSLHPLVLELVQRVAQVPITGLREVSQLDVAGPIVNEERPLNRRDRDLVALNHQVDQLVVSGAADRDSDRAAFGAAEQPHGLLTRHVFGILPRNPGYDIATADTCPIRGGPLEEAHHGDVTVDDVDGDPETVVATLLPLSHLGVRPGIHEAGVRIQRLQHAPDGLVDETLNVYLVDVVRLDRRQRGGERVVVLRDRFLGRENSTAEQSAGKRRQHDGGCADGQGRHTTHSGMLSNKPLPSNDFQAFFGPRPA